MRERYVVLGLAHARAPWFREVARWATSASLPLEFVKCVSVEELRARIGSGRAFSAALLDGSLAGVDRDLTELAREAGCAVLLIDDGRAHRDWSSLSPSAILPATLERSDLLDALVVHAQPIGRGEAIGLPVPAPATAAWQGALVAVTGVRGAGASTVAASLAQGLGDDPRYAGVLVLADLALDADQAVLHDAGDIVPGIPELVDAHRLGRPTVEEVRALTFGVTDRGYRLVLGLRRHRDWAALRPRAVEATIESLRRAYRVVVADVEPDVEGEDQCGSTDVEDRNVLARAAMGVAACVVVVGLPGPTRLHATLRVLEGLLGHGVGAHRIVTVVNRAPRNPRARAEITRALADLGRGLPRGEHLASPIFLPDRRRLDELVRDGHRLPAALSGPVTTAVLATLAAEDEADAVGPSPPAPVAVVPGSLPTYADDDA